MSAEAEWKTGLLFLLLTAARFALGFGFELVPQEAYYLLYAKALALSYFDHPPVLAYLLRGALWLFGERELAPRACAFLVTLGTQLLWLDLARRALGDRWRAGAALFLSTGLFTVLSLISTPDVPLLFFWTLALRWLWQALFEGKRWTWLAAGAAMGLAFDSKYTGVALQGGLALFLLLSPEHRRLWRTPWPWACLLLAQLCMAPVYVWNAQHGFASFLFQTQERAERATGLTALNFLKLLATQSALLGPVLLGALALAAVRWRWLRAQPQRLFLACFFVPTFAGFVALSAVALVKPNWMMPAYLAGALLAAELTPPRWLKASVAACLALQLAAAVELVFYPVPVNSDDTWVGWRALGREVDALVQARPGTFVLAADGYKTSAQLRFYSRAEVYGPNAIGERGLQFDYLDPDLSGLAGRDAYFLDSAPGDLTPALRGEAPGAVRERFERVSELAPLVVSERGRPARKFFVYLCQGYRPR